MSFVYREVATHDGVRPVCALSKFVLRADNVRGEEPVDWDGETIHEDGEEEKAVAPWITRTP